MYENGADILRKEIAKKMLLLGRIEKAMRNADDKSNVKVVENITKAEMVELLNATAGDEEFYESEFEIVWCGYRCRLWYGAENHNNIVSTIKCAIEDEEM